jgi:hypothetical protein
MQLLSGVALLITLVLQIGWSRCGLPPSNEITQNFLWNTGNYLYFVFVADAVVIARVF